MVGEKTFIVVVLWYVFLRSWRGASHDKDERRERFWAALMGVL